MADRPSFVDYQPVPLAFGTSGLRGLVVDLTDLEAYINVKGALRYLLAQGDVRTGGSVLLGGDLRPSTPRIMQACAQAIVDSGLGVENAGMLPTPALVLHGIETQRASVMVTGSHIPFDRNGIKVGKSVGELLKSDEPGILAEVARVRTDEYGKSASESAFDERGMLRRPAAPLVVNGDAEQRYLQRYVRAFSPTALSGKRVAFYEHSAVGRELVPRILRALGAEVVGTGRSETFVPLDTEAITDEQLAHLATLVREVEASSGPVDAIVSTDGDSDRPLVVAVRADRSLRFLPGDLLGAITAEFLEADFAALPVTTNDGVDTHLSARGVAISKTKVGSPYVVAALQVAHGAKRPVGWEANGGFLVGGHLALAHGPLGPLPTRDALLPIVANLAAAISGLDAHWSRLPPRYGRAGLMDAVAPALSAKLHATLVRATDVVQVDFADAHDVWLATKALLEQHFHVDDGFGKVARLDVRDGVRAYFDNDDVVHLRASGNAPQLRVYAIASTQARADAIVAASLGEPDGIVRRMLALVAG